MEKMFLRILPAHIKIVYKNPYGLYCRDSLYSFFLYKALFLASRTKHVWLADAASLGHCFLLSAVVGTPGRTVIWDNFKLPEQVYKVPRPYMLKTLSLHVL